MTLPASAALRFGAAALIAQLLLQIVWHAGLAPVSRPALALAVLPLLPGLWVCIRNLPRGVLIGGIASLFYFCHGVVDLLGAGASRLPAAAEVALAVAVVAALGWDTRQRKTATTGKSAAKV
ncbi:MAG TPA: DUF2069 domain-containing protein [Rhodanobacteraceae bacterium]|jgi:uncharacterized membrane protein|nr:DUF2069 domain-containing protein [Rhodanobacteraceae bacterium]